MILSNFPNGNPLHGMKVQSDSQRKLSQTHNPKVVSSNLPPATISMCRPDTGVGPFLLRPPRGEHRPVCPELPLQCLLDLLKEEASSLDRSENVRLDHREL